MRDGAVSSSELGESGRRLNAGYFLAEDELAIRRLRNWSRDSVPLGEIIADIYSGPIFKKISVEAGYGVGYVSANDLFRASVAPSDYLSYRHGELLDALRLVPGTIALTCSGMNLGKSIWIRQDMKDLAGSGDLIRIVPNARKAPGGYVFAFMASRYGVASVRRLIFGGHIKHISPGEVSRILVPRLGDKIERRAHELVRKAAKLRAEASSTLLEVTAAVEFEIGAPAVRRLGDDPRGVGNPVSIDVIRTSRRFEAFFYNPVATDLDRWVAEHPNGHWQLGELANVFDVPPFKHIYVGEDRGVPFYTSGDLFRLERFPEKYLSRTRTKDLGKYILKAGWVLLARSGQLGGIIGRPQFADSALDDASASDHVIRIVPACELVPPGYLYAYLSTPTVGYTLLTRTMTGASVPALWPKYLNEVCVVKASARFMKEIDGRVQRAFEQRVTATQHERAARTLVELAIEEAT